MKNLLIIISLALLSITAAAQVDTYLVFEFMKVNNDQELDYLETETFWEKIHAERVKRKEILAWDLWTLKPGGTEQGYQYLTVTAYDDLVKALEEGDVFRSAKLAYPELSEENVNKAIQRGNESRDLRLRMFLHVIKKTDNTYDMKIGTVMRINFMEVNQTNHSKYEKVEGEFFKPIHEKNINDGLMSFWSLAKVVIPTGSNVKTSHLTFDIYSGYKQLIDSYNADNSISDEEKQAQLEKVIDYRNLQWSYLATLIKTVK